MKHILIDGTPVSRQMDGLTQYILNVVLRLDMLAFRYTLLLRPNQCPDYYMQQLRSTPICIEEVDIAPIGPLRDIQFARYLRSRDDFDAAFIPSNQYPRSLRLPAIYVVHDLIYEQFPEQLGKFSILKRWYLRRVVKVGLCRAKKVVAVSQYTCDELIRCYGEKYRQKIQVIYEGWEHLLNSQVNEKSKVDIPFSQYLLYVGSSRGHKNLSRLIAAIQTCKYKLPANFGLVIVGNHRMFKPEELRLIDNLNHDHCIIYLTGWLSDDRLAYCFQHAKGFIFPSLCEGFGIPILEAFYYQIPLLLSNQSSLPEVAGDAAIYFSPTDVEDIANTILRFVEQQNFEILLAKQNQRLKQFSWNTTAAEISKIW